MAHQKLSGISAVGCAVILFMNSAVQAQSVTSNEREMQARLVALTQEMADQRTLLDHLETFHEPYAEQRALLQALERQVAQQQVELDEVRGVTGWNKLATMRGTGSGTLGEPTLTAQAQSQDAAPVGRAPATDGRPPEIAPLFEQPGVLTAKGRYVLEPSVQYGYSSSNRISLVGYTIIPALLIGVIDVKEVKRNTTTAALSARLGVTNRLELEMRVPYVYRSDMTVSGQVGTATSANDQNSANGIALGDIELGARYQLNNGEGGHPFYIGSLRLKSRTGTDPFSVVSLCTISCRMDPAVQTGTPLDLPTGSGFFSAQVGLTALYPSDPAVFFGSVTYLHSFSRDNVTRKILNGQDELLGTISPGDVFGFNFGMGLALNETASVSLGYDHSSVGITQQNGQDIPGSVRTQLGTLLLGYSYRFNPKTSLNVSVGAGLTRDTPDMSLTVRLPMTY